MVKTPVPGIITDDEEELNTWIQEKLKNNYVVWHIPNTSIAVILGKIEECDACAER
ncbi:MAG: hypothetical protein QXP38_12590 [Nitrososphaerota archaeon]